MTVTRRPGEGGFTLVELLISVSILSMVMLTAFAAVKMVGDSLAAETLDNLAYSAVERVVAAIAEDLHYAQITDIDDVEWTWINFQVPVDLNGDGTIEDTELGFLLGGRPTPGSVTYAFEADELPDGSPRTVSEGMWGDLNGDGDSADTFDLGHMVKLMKDTDTGDEITQRMGNWIIQPTDNWGGDIDGDAAGDDDPIFSRSGKRVTISLWSLGVDPRVAPRLANSTSVVHAINTP